MSQTDIRSSNAGSIAVALGITLLGVGLLGGLGYAEATTSVDEEYAEYATNCGELANESRLVDAGLGLERVELDGTDVERCQNSSFEACRERRYRSFGATPLNPGQWILFGGLGSSLAFGGSVVLRQELRR